MSIDGGPLGMWSDPIQITDPYSDFAALATLPFKSTAEERTGQRFEKFVPVSYQQRVVDGMEYKVAIDWGMVGKGLSLQIHTNPGVSKIELRQVHFGGY